MDINKLARICDSSEDALQWKDIKVGEKYLDLVDDEKAEIEVLAKDGKYIIAFMKALSSADPANLRGKSVDYFIDSEFYDELPDEADELENGIITYRKGRNGIETYNGEPITLARIK